MGCRDVEGGAEGEPHALDRLHRLSLLQGRPPGLCNRAALIIHDRAVQAFFAAEVVVDHPFVDAGALDDRADAGTVQPELCELLGGGREKGFLALTHAVSVYCGPPPRQALRAWLAFPPSPPGPGPLSRQAPGPGSLSRQAL